MIEAADAAKLARPGERIYVGGCLAEPTAVLDAVRQAPDLWRSVTLTGAFIPGVNGRALASHGLSTRVETIFATESLRADDPAVSILPLHYSTFYELLARPGHVDIAYIQVPRPRADGTIGLGPSADFSPAVIASGARLVGLVNPHLPDVVDGPRLPRERFEALVEVDDPLLSYDAGAIDAATQAIAGHIAATVCPGDTIQLGLGKVQAAMLAALSDHRDLGFHAGMISGPMLRALESGVFSRGITTGVALGPADFLQAVAARADIRFAPVGHTHAQATLAAIDNLVSINSVIEVDLFGQANGESLGGRQISGHGGMVDFVRGARASRGGRSILALPSTTKGGSVSRIVPFLPMGGPVSVSRADTDIVATEFGMVELRHAGMDERAEKLISIAAPQFRDGLAAQWHAYRSGNLPLPSVMFPGDRGEKNGF